MNGASGKRYSSQIGSEIRSTSARARVRLAGGNTAATANNKKDER
jgi:hypothetical protein